MAHGANSSSTGITRTCNADPTYSQKWTWSGWVKRSGISSEQGIFSNERTDNHVNSRFKLRFIASDKITWECKDSGGSDDSSLVTNAVFRDTSGWCHICFVYDTDNGTAAGSLGTFAGGSSVSATVVATSDSAVTYTNNAGSGGTLPGGVSMSTGGVFSGTETGSTETTTYTFEITPTDAESQVGAAREFTMTISHGATGGAQFN